MNKKKLSSGDKKRLEQYARRTATGYCTGCADICESAVDIDVPISDMIRCSMYHHSYGDREKAIALFNELPPDTKANILMADYSIAEKQCPQKIQIGKVLKQTHDDLS